MKYWAGLFCLLGHMFPCMFHFKGGKGILSGGTIAIMIEELGMGIFVSGAAATGDNRFRHGRNTSINSWYL